MAPSKELPAKDPNAVKRDVRRLCKTLPAAEAFFKIAAKRKNDAVQTKISRIASLASIGYGDALVLARELDKVGCGKLVLGRKGQESRIRWNYGLPNLGSVALERTELLEAVSDEVEEDYRDIVGEDTLTIPEAKRRLANTLGISPEKIEIIIRD